MKAIKLVIIALVTVATFFGICARQDASAGDVQTVVDANNQFAIDLYNKYKSQEGNIFFSPYSISAALAMTYEGARGKTADEIRSVFYLPEDDGIRRAGFTGIYNEINKKDKKYLLNTANALWAQKGDKFLNEYFNLINKYYGGRVTNLDFINETEKSRIIINRWVEDQTSNKIKDLIPEGMINATTSLVLTNAIYFKGNWLKQFDKENTRYENFYLGPEKAVKTQMMRLEDAKARVNYAETQEMQILELPYTDEELSMLILLPRKNDLNFLEESLSINKLVEWKKSLRKEEVYIYLPKFKFETKYFMAETLTEMGMPTAFSSDADFSGMTGERGLSIAEVIHQAFVDVNEEGTEAAAATAVIMYKSVAMEPQPMIFRADHPFIFIIQQKTTGNILFMSRVNDPTK